MAKNLTCTDCALNGCEFVDGPRPSFCPSNEFVLEEQGWLQQRFAEPENRRIIEAAATSANEAFWGKLSHLEETLIFARELGARTIGIASCVSLATEARAAARVFEAHGFEVVGALCKIGGVTFGDLGIERERCTEKMALCNPIYQAKVLNEANADLNVVMGLCTGHDSLFLKYVEGLCTFLTPKTQAFVGGVISSYPSISCRIRLECTRFAVRN